VRANDQELTAQRSRDLERFITFIDAIVAIAITLLVLPLVDLVPELGEDSVAELLRDHQPEIWGFFLSFAVIAQLWFSQHHIIRSVVAQDPLVTRLLLAWTLTIVFLPFPTALVAEAGHQATTKVLYIGTMALSSACLALIAWGVRRDRSIRDTDAEPDLAPSVATVLGFLLALAISLAVPSTSYYPLLVLLTTDPLVRWWRRARGGQSDSPRVGE
jgi:uncharacterized membrane protein